jgi:hypothetical protein
VTTSNHGERSHGRPALFCQLQHLKRISTAVDMATAKQHPYILADRTGKTVSLRAMISQSVRAGKYFFNCSLGKWGRRIVLHTKDDWHSATVPRVRDNLQSRGERELCCATACALRVVLCCTPSDEQRMRVCSNKCGSEKLEQSSAFLSTVSTRTLVVPAAAARLVQAVIRGLAHLGLIISNP